MLVCSPSGVSSIVLMSGERSSREAQDQGGGDAAENRDPHDPEQTFMIDPAGRVRHPPYGTVQISFVKIHIVVLAFSCMVMIDSNQYLRTYYPQ